MGLLQDNRLLTWGHWPQNGTQSNGVTRKHDAVETFALLSTDYSRITAPMVVELLRTMEGPAAAGTS